MEVKIFVGVINNYEFVGSKNKAYVEIKMNDGNFSACGEIWNNRRNDLIACGQCLDEIANHITTDEFKKIYCWWKRWHLNNLKAGCAHQRELGWKEEPIDSSKPLNSYGKFPPNDSPSWNMKVWLPEKLGGYLSKPCPICGYRYGTKWLKEEITEPDKTEILSWFQEKGF